MKNSVRVASKSPDIRFLQKTGTTLLMMALVAGAVTIFGAATSPQADFVWPSWQMAVEVVAD